MIVNDVNENSLMYIGESYGEQAYAATGREAYHNVYIDLSRKNSRQLANIAIVVADLSV